LVDATGFDVDHVARTLVLATSRSRVRFVLRAQAPFDIHEAAVLSKSPKQVRLLSARRELTQSARRRSSADHY